MLGSGWAGRRRFGSYALVAAAWDGAWLLRGAPRGNAADGPLRPSGAPSAPTPDVAARAAGIGRRHGLLIGFGRPAEFFVPPYRASDTATPGTMAMTPAAIADLPPALDGIAGSLACYPPGFYAQLCRAIFLCGTLRFEGAYAGGSYGPAWIILAADPRFGPDAIRETARLGVHHEFSSLVLARIPGLEARWATLLPAGWTPVLRTRDALLRTGPTDGSDGFLSAYAATSAENDFNTYAETAFGEPARLAALAGRFPAVRRKAALLLGAYAALDPRLLRTFRDLGLGGLPVEQVDTTVVFSVRPAELPRPAVIGR